MTATPNEPVRQPEYDPAEPEEPVAQPGEDPGADPESDPGADTGLDSDDAPPDPAGIPDAHPSNAEEDS
ncbi:MAG: hypothetical protein JOZ82_10555 [Marmoricola sp.]|nr:hypothetical protein [Marmoricola sp.]